MASFWQYNAPHRFSYTRNPDSKGKAQVLSDWNRLLGESGNAQIFIRVKEEGQEKERSLGQLRGGKPFANVEELQDFFSTVLFSEVSDDTTRMKLVEEALLIFHQGGLPFASHHCLTTYSDQYGKTNVRFSSEQVKTTFIPTKDGVLIKEENTYSQLVVKRMCRGTQKITTDKPDDYYAKTSSEVLFCVKDNETRAEIKEFLIDCPNRYAAEAIDSRGFVELLQHIIEKLLQAIRPKQDDQLSAGGGCKL
ncbi:Uncharacterised protein [Legionella lansingensis]|uniref:Uncharacterized protein n=1 Tax=Legionella lansingensis TaxID=45067 RepID=A0A0W0VFM0_9GAMM|nr:hypothetical protein [Legionella lansingensis]KTD18859.1 hypothetical protein Llan_2462 [Legionella lansingensis]SNV52745.1 Uncharacterised protein [Legionella lansingensis]